MSRVAVIGAGIFGSVVAAALRKDGHTVTVLDAMKEGSGSKPAACLMKTSWFSSMGKDKYEPSLRLLDDLYGVQDIPFSVLGPVKATVHWCDPEKILQQPNWHSEVHSVMRTASGWLLHTTTGELSADVVVVAAGIWSNSLVGLPELAPGLVGRAGVSFRWHDMQIENPFINPWAPYRQLVGFNISKTDVWVGDGTAIKPDNWTSDREAVSYARCANAIGRAGFGDREVGRVSPLYGIRPYLSDAKPCLVQERLPGLWINTGGAKNGTIAAGWAAHVIREALK